MQCYVFYTNWMINYLINLVSKLKGANGTIDGQGEVWWNMWRQRTLSFTRPHLIELMYSSDVVISNIVFKNSPFWNIHPVYCR